MAIKYIHNLFRNAAAGAGSLFTISMSSSNRSDELSRGLLSHSDDINLGGCKAKPKSYMDTASSFFLRLLILARLFLAAITPSFIPTLHHPTKPRHLHKTSFLDGFRGCASFIVAVFHLEGIPPNNEWVQEPWGVNEDEGMGSNILQLPFIRVLFSGPPMVTCFFIISGFVLSYRNLGLIRSGDYERLSESLASLIFRRGFRLFLPSIAGIALKEVLFPYIYPSWSPPPLRDMVSNMYGETSTLVYAWNWDAQNASLLHLWTIPIEFACSMFLFLVIIGVSRLGIWIRLTVVGTLMVHATASGHWGIFLFMVGLFLAETEHIIEERKRIQDTTKRVNTPQPCVSRLQSLFWIAVFVVGVFLAGYPMRGAEVSYDFGRIYPFTPKVFLDMGGQNPLNFWCSVAAALVFAAMFRLPVLQKPFTTPIAQYLGDISYSVYLVHHVVQISVGKDIKPQVHTWFSADDSQWKRVIILFLDIVITMGVITWVADIFWRYVDKPIIQFTRYFDKMCRKPKVVGAL